VAVLDDPGGLDLGLLTHLGDDRGALLARLLTDLRRLVAGVGDLRLELPLGVLGVLSRLIGLCELLADRLLARRHRPVDRRDDVAPHDEDDDRERDQLHEERRVGDEEVVRQRDDRTRNACHHRFLCFLR